MSEPIIYKSEAEVLLAINGLYPASQYAVLPQVADSTGGPAVRTADALVMSLWPSRGLHLIGIEIKVSRADWLRELKEPEKADRIGGYCDFWRVAVGDESIVKDGELPPAWGLLVPGRKPGTMRLKAPGSQIEQVKPISRGFLAAILRNVANSQIPFAAVEEELNRRVKQKLSEMRAEVTSRIAKELDRDRLLKRNADLEAMLDAFEKASGINLFDSLDDIRQLGEALKLLRWGGLDSWLVQAKDRLSTMTQDIDELQATLLKADIRKEAA